MGEGYNKKTQKLVEQAETFAIHCTMEFLCVCLLLTYVWGILKT